MGKELDKIYYNKVYTNGGHKGKYFEDAHLIKEYYPSWKEAYKYIKDNNVKFVIDLGCGPGHFSSIFNEEDNINYVGYDFSEVAIQQAIKRNERNKNNTFIIKDLSNFEVSNECNFYTSFEFLEHISFDMIILSKLKKDDKIIFSVPNYDSEGHIRFFENESEIEKRYGKLLKLKKISVTEIKSHKIFIYLGVKK